MARAGRGVLPDDRLEVCLAQGPGPEARNARLMRGPVGWIGCWRCGPDHERTRRRYRRISCALRPGRRQPGAARRRRLGPPLRARRRRERRLVLMDAPPAALDLGPFLTVGAWLRAQGLSAPAVVAMDRAAGFVLLEDLGDDLYRPLLARGGGDELRSTAPRSSCSCAAAGAAPVVAALRRCLAVARGAAAGRMVRPALGAAAAADYALSGRTCCRWRGSAATASSMSTFTPTTCSGCRRAGLARIGLLDFQDARSGPPAYDLVSLLGDARRDVNSEVARATAEHYLAARPELDTGAFGAACAVLGAQRNAKILGLFARLAERDGKRQYLELQPRVRAHLARGAWPSGAGAARHLVRASSGARRPALSRRAPSVVD